MSGKVRIFLGMDRPTRTELEKILESATGSYAAICPEGCHNTTQQGMRECWRRGHYDTPKYIEIEGTAAEVLRAAVHRTVSEQER